MTQGYGYFYAKINNNDITISKTTKGIKELIPAINHLCLVSQIEELILI